MTSWTTACPDWERRILAHESLIPFPPLFPAEADAAEQVFRDLRIVDAPGSPTMGEACLPWVFDFVRSVFGSYDAENGRRLIREFFMLISKKNSKSTTAASIMLTALVRNWRKSAEFLILAPTLEVALNAYKPASDMVRANPELAAIMDVKDHWRTIIHTQTGASLKVVAADNDAVGGKKAVGVLIDELWLFGKQPKAENMLREATGGLASRPEGFIIWLSTQSDEPPAGVFRQKLQYARGVRDGRIKDDRFLPIIYEFPEWMSKRQLFREKSNFYVTNPNLGRSTDREFLDREYDKAVEEGEHSLRGFFAKYLNVEIGLALQSDRWRGADHWEMRADRSITLETLLKRCEAVVAGIDGGGLDDLLALCILGRETGTRRWLAWHKTWVHRSVLELRKSEAPRLLDFEAAGELTIVDDMLTAFADLALTVQKVDEGGLLFQVGLDPVGVGLIVEALSEAGIEPERNIGVTQGWKLTGAIKTAEVKLASGEMIHAGQAVTAWAVSNVKIEAKGNAFVATKQAAGTGKIDPFMALCDCVALMSAAPQSVEGIYSVLDRIDEKPIHAFAEHHDVKSVGSGDAWSPEILADMTHPDFLKHKARFERWQDLQPD